MTLKRTETMKNPWIRKNPFMSAWLSAANTAASTARAGATAEAKRQTNALMTEGARQVAAFWAGALAPPAAKRGKKRR
jgi:hypothetical protein